MGLASADIELINAADIKFAEYHMIDEEEAMRMRLKKWTFGSSPTDGSWWCTRSIPTMLF